MVDYTKGEGKMLVIYYSEDYRCPSFLINEVFGKLGKDYVLIEDTNEFFYT